MVEIQTGRPGRPKHGTAGVNMRIHPIQTGTVTIKTRQVEGHGHGAGRRLDMMRDPTWTQPLPILAWVIEHPEGLVVVDTGETARTSQPGYFPRWHPYFRMGVREWVDPDQEIGPQMKALGLDPREVRWLIMTHLHTDHAGGLGHFPLSEILVSRTELREARGLGGKFRGYLPQHWPAWLRPHQVEFHPEAYGPFAESLPVTRAADVRLVPTPGHTKGHLSVVVEEQDCVVFIAGDASYRQDLMLRRAVDGISPDEGIALKTLEAINALVVARPTVYLPSHDPESPARLENRRVVGASPQEADSGESSAVKAA
jgi:N-acyl homoserine lactone hydrolase